MMHYSTIDAPRENKRRELFFALTSRVLTSEELLAVGAYGSRLNIEMMVSFNMQEKLQELTNALLVQQLLRQAFDD